MISNHQVSETTLMTELRPKLYGMALSVLQINSLIEDVNMSLHKEEVLGRLKQIQDGLASTINTLKNK